MNNIKPVKLLLADGTTCGTMNSDLSCYDNVTLVAKAYGSFDDGEVFDLILATWNNSMSNTLYLGHWNNGIK